MRIKLIVLACVFAVLAAQPSALTATRVTVSTTATLLYTGPALPSGVCPDSVACRVLVRNPSTVSLYIGTSTVTTATGFEIAAGDALSIHLRSNEGLYGIVAAATQVVHTVTP